MDVVVFNAQSDSTDENSPTIPRQGQKPADIACLATPLEVGSGIYGSYDP